MTDPLTQLVDLAEAVHRVAASLDLTFVRAGDEKATVWASVLHGVESIAEWWASQLREGAYPPDLDMADVSVIAGARLMPCSYVPAAARLNAWVCEALRGGLLEAPGGPPQAELAGEWSTLSLLASSLMSETSRMLAAAGAVASTHVVVLPRGDCEGVKSIWRTCWDAGMDFLVSNAHMVSHAGVSQAVGLGRLPATSANAARVHIPTFNGWASRALSLLLTFAKQRRHTFGRRATAIADSGTEGGAGGPASPPPESAAEYLRRRRQLDPWPPEPGPKERRGDSMAELADGPVRTAEVNWAVAWEFCTFGFLMMAVASAPYRSRRRPLLYLPPCRWDVLVASRGMLLDPDCMAVPFDVRSAEFRWERTNVVVRDDGDESGGELSRAGFRGGALHLTAHTVESIRPLSFALSAAHQPTSFSAAARRRHRRQNQDQHRHHHQHPGLASRRWEKKGGSGAAAADQPPRRFQAQVRTVLVNPAAWSFFGVMV